MSKPTNEAAPSPAPPELLGKRSGVYKLLFPIKYDGKLWDKVTVSRMTTQQVAAFIDTVRADGEDAQLPMYDVPKAVLDALDPDDVDGLQEMTFDFLPSRLKPGVRPPSQTGASTSPSAPTSSAAESSNTNDEIGPT